MTTLRAVAELIGLWILIAVVLGAVAMVWVVVDAKQTVVQHNKGAV